MLPNEKRNNTPSRQEFGSNPSNVNNSSTPKEKKASLKHPYRREESQSKMRTEVVPPSIKSPQNEQYQHTYKRGSTAGYQDNNIYELKSYASPFTYHNKPSSERSPGAQGMNPSSASPQYQCSHVISSSESTPPSHAKLRGEKRTESAQSDPNYIPPAKVSPEESRVPPYRYTDQHQAQYAWRGERYPRQYVRDSFRPYPNLSTHQYHRSELNSPYSFTNSATSYVPSRPKRHLSSFNRDTPPPPPPPPPYYYPRGHQSHPRHHQYADTHSSPYDSRDWQGSTEDRHISKLEESSSSRPEKKHKQSSEETTGCTCQKSKCLKLYCQCFAIGEVCQDHCRCIDCENKQENQAARLLSIQAALQRNPRAFDDKFEHSQETKESTSHAFGCKCRRSACLKKYCECFHHGVKCNSRCQCINCENVPVGMHDKKIHPTPLLDYSALKNNSQAASSRSFAQDVLDAKQKMCNERHIVQDRVSLTPALTKRLKGIFGETVLNKLISSSFGKEKS